jgi:hypothetical protein
VCVCTKFQAARGDQTLLEFPAPHERIMCRPDLMYTAYCYVLHRLASLSPQQSLPGAEQTTAIHKLQIHLFPSVTSHVDGHTRVFPSSQLITSSSVTTLSVTLPDISTVKPT